MSEHHVNMRTFVDDIITPHMVNLRDYLNSKIILVGENAEKRINDLEDDLRALLERYRLEMNAHINEVERRLDAKIDAFIVEVEGELGSLEDRLTNMIEALRADLNALLNLLHNHINNKNNPHDVRPGQVFTISSFAPKNNEGSIGDVHIQYLSQTIN